MSGLQHLWINHTNWFSTSIGPNILYDTAITGTVALFSDVTNVWGNQCVGKA